MLGGRGVPSLQSFSYAKPAVALTLVRKNISGMSKHVLTDQTLRNMRGHSTGHRIDFYKSGVIGKGSFRIRKTLEVTNSGLSRRTLAILDGSSDTGIAFLIGSWAFIKSV